MTDQMKFPDEGSKLGICSLLKRESGNSLAVQWLGLSAFIAEGPGSIPGWGMKIPQALRHSQKKKKHKNKKGESVIQKNPRTPVKTRSCHYQKVRKSTQRTFLQGLTLSSGTVVFKDGRLLLRTLGNI